MQVFGGTEEKPGNSDRLCKAVRLEAINFASTFAYCSTQDTVCYGNIESNEEIVSLTAVDSLLVAKLGLSLVAIDLPFNECLRRENRIYQYFQLYGQNIYIKTVYLKFDSF